MKAAWLRQANSQDENQQSASQFLPFLDEPVTKSEQMALAAVRHSGGTGAASRPDYACFYRQDAG